VVQREADARGPQPADSAVTPGESVPRIVDFSPSLVGRQHECEILRHQLARAGDETRVVLIAGEPGIGKTCLLTWIGAQAGQQGATVLRGGASQADGMPPYLPLLEALGQYVRSAERGLLREQAGPLAATLSAIVPELVTRLGEMPPGYPLPPEQARLRFFEAVGAFLAAIGDRSTLVLLLDDLQWADSSTLDLLCHVTRTQPSARLLIVGAYRDVELGDNAALQRAVAEFSRQRRLTNLDIGPLSQAEMAMLAANHLVGPIDAELGSILHRQSEGNPFFAEELLRGWLETGGLARRGLGWFVSISPGQALPPTIVGAIRQRVARLAPEIVDHLHVAAAVGRSFQAALLATVTGQEVDEIERCLQTAAASRLVQDRRDGVYAFSHDRIREYLYAEMGGVRRQRLHERIGAALESDGSSAGRPGAAELAFHFARAGDRERALTYALQAAASALEHAALEEALQHYRTARTLVDRADARHGEILLQLGEAALLAGNEDEAVSAFAEARATLLAMHDAAGAGRATHGLGVARLRRDAYLEARVAFEAALALLKEHDGPETVRVLVDLASLLSVSMGQQSEGVARAQQALEMARRLGDIRLEAAAGRVMGNLEVRGNKVVEGVQLLESALALAQAVDDPTEAAECCACLANAYYWMADIQRSQEYTALREEFARRCQQPYELRHVYSWRAFMAATQGDWEAAERTLEQAHRAVEGLLGAEPLAFLHQIQGFLVWQQGDQQRAEQEFRTAAAIYRQQGSGTLVWYLGPLGLAQLSLGLRQEALDLLSEMEALVDALPEGIMPAAPALTSMMLMAVRLGDRARAARYYPRLRAFSGQLHWFLIDLALGAGQALCGERDSARACLDLAERAARRAGMRPALAEIQQIKRDLDADPGAGRTLPAGLSRREAEVLRLVAAGMYNREIARALHLSENTVAKHLTSIFNKTGSENRAAAATFAARHGLV
jgi:DNA-binding CsgD family transcriptional regulator